MNKAASAVTCTDRGGIGDSPTDVESFNKCGSCTHLCPTPCWESGYSYCKHGSRLVEPVISREAKQVFGRNNCSVILMLGFETRPAWIAVTGGLGLT